MAWSIKLHKKSKYTIPEKLENLLCFATILCIFIFNFNEEGGRTITNMLIIFFIGVEIFLTSQKSRARFNYCIVLFGLFTVICMFSCLYSTAQADSITKAKTLVILWFFMLGLNIYLYNKDRIDILMKIIVYASIVAALYLLKNSAWASGARATRIIGDSNQAGAYFAYSVTVIFYCLKQKKINKIIGWAGIAINVFAILISGSRSSLLEVFVGLLFLQVLLDNINNEKYYKQFIGFLFIVAAVIAIYHFAMTNETLYKILGIRIESLFEIMSGKKSSINENSTLERQYLIEEGLSRFRESPLLGKGIGSFAQYIFPKVGKLIFAHNNYVELLQGVGLLGTVVFYTFHFISMKSFFKKRNEKTTLAAVLIMQMLVAHYAVVFYYQKLEIIFMSLIMYLICANSEENYLLKSNTRVLRDRRIKL
ncbi:MAG: O-antigen ligase family protein [Candidatus Ornithomonoglobus sp.]